MSPIDYGAFLAKINSAQPDTAAPLDQEEAGLPASRTATDSPLATRLEAVAGKAIGKLDELLSIPLDPAAENFGAVSRAQNAAANTALITQTRVDEGRMKQKQADKLGELLELIRVEEAKLPPRRLVHGDRDG